MKAFKLNGCDIVAANTQEEAIAYLMGMCQMTRDEVFDADEACEMSLDAERTDEEDGTTATYQEIIDEWVAANGETPFHLATTEA